jgi:hypothetical protein
MWLALALLAVPAHAGTAKAPPPSKCDAQIKALTDAGPSAAAKAFSELAACDPAAANKAAPDAFKKVLAGEAGDAALVAAIGVGSGEVARGWITAMEPDDRSRTISQLGHACTSPGVPQFFFDTQKSLGDKFWSERWYRGLTDCREPAVQDLLRARIAEPGGDRTLFFGVMEVFSRNLGKDAIPTLKAAVLAEKDPEVATYIVNAFADAAGVGRPGGADPESVKLAVAALDEVAPSLPPRAVDQARTTLLTLGAEADSDKLAIVRYKDVMQASGGLLYGVAATEIATCKKGDVRMVFHHAQVNEGGHTWPDQVAERIAPAVTAGFKLDLATSCKGTGTVENASPPAPFKDAAAYDEWVKGVLLDVQKAHPGVKPKLVEEDPLSL